MTTSLRIVFAGTPDFAAKQLAALHHHGYTLVGIFTPPDRPVGRGRQYQACPVKQVAQAHHLPIYQPTGWKETDAAEILRALNPDLMIVSAYGFILPRAILSIPRYGCWNVHASLLPKWRGASPLQHAILAGDRITGVTLMQMAPGMDTGDALLQASTVIEDSDTTETLSEKLSAIGADLLKEGLDAIEATLQKAQPQDHAAATYCNKIQKIDGKIDWNQSAMTLARRVRAFRPWPIAFFEWKDTPIRLWDADALPQKSAASPGKIMAISTQGVAVATGDGVLLLKSLQFPGKNRVPAHTTLGRWHVGDILQ